MQKVTVKEAYKKRAVSALFWRYGTVLLTTTVLVAVAAASLPTRAGNALASLFTGCCQTSFFLCHIPSFFLRLAFLVY